MQKGLILLLLATALWGCGSNRDSDHPGDRTSSDTSIVDAQNVGSDACHVCHALAHNEFSPVAGQGVANSLEVTHDCEDCHGGGEYHNGIGPMPFASPSGDRCATCHEQAASVIASKHNAEAGANSEMLADGHDTGKCQRCHTAEGANAFADVVGAKAAYDAIYGNGAVPTGEQTREALPNLDADGNRILHNPTCSACHNPLTKEMVVVPGWDPNGNATADQFDLCTSCHLYQLADGTIVNSGLALTGGAVTEAFYHDTAWYRNITSTHFDNPATGPQTDGSDADTDPDTNTKIEGYVLRKTGENPCFDCHGHELVTKTGNLIRSGEGYVQAAAAPTIHTDWAKSAHAGDLLRVKYAAQAGGNKFTDGTLKRDATLTQIVTNAYTDDSTDPGLAWTHYDWDNNATRAGCQRCHTATGAANYLSAPATYDQAGNDFSHLSGWSTNGRSDQQELLYCWGCHDSVETGELRNPGAVSVKSLDNPPVVRQIGGVDVVLPDAGKSNGCISCHSGTGNMFSPWSETRIPSHHGVSAAVLFGTTARIGYEFVDLGGNYLDYRIPTTITAVVKTHAQIGMEAGGTGPCVGCHMPAAKHLFAAVDEEAQTIPAQALCDTCHTVAMTYAKIEEEKEGYFAAGDLLRAYIANTIANYKTAVVDGTATAANDRAAWYNSKLFPTEEKGAFAHNRFYTKRLIFDSIDWLDNGVIDGNVTIDSASYPHAAIWFDADATTGVATRP